MKLRFTNHAQYRIFYERGISAEEIKKVIAKPNTSKNLPNGLIKSRKELNKGILTVVYSKSKKKEFIIITAYFQ